MAGMNLIFRRVHLYLGMFLMPWLLVYAVSTFFFNHGPVFRTLRPPPDAWTQLWEKACSDELPQSQEGLRAWAREVLDEAGFSTGAFGVQRNAERVLINAPRFIKPIRITYRLGEGTLIAEQRTPSWIESFQRMHTRHGYGQEASLQMLWGVAVDAVCFSFIIWTLTGLYLWWKLPSARSWGWVAIAAGMLSFFGLLVSF